VGSATEPIRYLNPVDIHLLFKSAKELAPKFYNNWNEDLASTSNVSLPTMQANARSWQNFGNESVGEEGDIVVLWRENPTSWKGHVAFLKKKGLTYVELLGGNQANKVGYKDYTRTRVLAYRKGIYE